MTVKSQSGLFPTLLSHRQYSGTVSTLLYNWPIFAGALFFGVVTITVSTWLPSLWGWLFFAGGLGVLALAVNILVTTFFVYDCPSPSRTPRTLCPLLLCASPASCPETW